MLGISQKVKEVYGYTADAIPRDIIDSKSPIIFKGLIQNWPLVAAGLTSDATADAYLRTFYNGRPVVEYFGPPEIEGRYFYNSDFTGLNFESHTTPLTQVLDKIFKHHTDALPPCFYIGSTSVDTWLPGFRQHNDLALNTQNPLVSIWIGNASRIACHYDTSDNMACVAVGKRRFTLFPPEQVGNLYPGPIDFTPSGQAISLVDFSAPDYEKFPRFREALKHAQVAEMEAGDALFLPSMWWHNVEALSRFNVLVNYWWTSVPAYSGNAIDALKHAMLSVRDLPSDQKAAWKSLFDYYIFAAPEQAQEHIPPQACGSLAPTDEIGARKLRAWLINKLNR